MVGDEFEVKTVSRAFALLVAGLSACGAPGSAEWIDAIATVDPMFGGGASIEARLRGQDGIVGELPDGFVADLRARKIDPRERERLERERAGGAYYGARIP